jgi:AraC-like DNA-binding protein
MSQPFKHGHLPKDIFLSDRLVFINQVKNSTLYRPETALSHMHFHDFVELSLVVSGKRYHRTLHECSECIPGDVYVINEGAPHAYFANSDGDCPVVCNLIFDPKDILDGKYARYDHPEYCYGVFRENGMIAYMMLTSKMMSDMNDILESMEKELAQREYQWEQALKAYLVNFLIQASRYIAPLRMAQSSQANKQHRLTASIMRCALDQYSNPDLTLQHLAETLFVSASSAGRAFRQTTGENFGDYIRRIRLENAES